MPPSGTPGCPGDTTLAAFVAGSLRPEDLAAIDQHLVACGDCTWVVSSAALDEPSPAPEPFIAERAIPADRFERLAFIARGAMGVVHRGRDRQTGAPVAIKRLQLSAVGRDPDAVARFVRESEILGRLNHPNIVQIIASSHDGDEHQIVMEYVGGGSLRSVLNAEGRLAPERAVSLMLELTDALARAHHLNVIHRDIKPENILIAADGTPRLSDFGLARLTDQAVTGTAFLVGTIPYLSPEALSGLALDERADLWALGVILFEALAGFRPFRGSDPAAVMSAILHEALPDLSAACPAAPEALLELTHRMLTRDRDQRIDSARHVGALLEDIRKGKNRPVRGSPSSPTAPYAALAARQYAHPVSPHVVGRREALAALHAALQNAVAGQRQTVFVTGEPGIGKTTLVSGFLNQLQETGAYWLCWGQCIRQFGAGEAYLPVLEALGRMCRDSPNGPLLDLMRRHAPSWLAELPPLVSATADATPVRPVRTVTTPQRMLREMAELAERLAQDRPLVLLLEDLHWADYSTLELLSYLARRFDPARLLVLGTLRPMAANLPRHPIADIQVDLMIRGACRDLALDYLDERAVQDYLFARFPDGRWPTSLVQLLQRRTGGNPLFLVKLVNDWVSRNWLIQTTRGWQFTVEPQKLEHGVPQSLEGLLCQESERLNSFEGSVLRAASVAGFEFSAESVAAAIDSDREPVEELCTRWARRGQFFRFKGHLDWPDGTVAAGYEFIHQLYQELEYDRIPRSLQVHLHRRIGERRERGYAGVSQVIAAELAVHFERAQELDRAISYRKAAGDQALQRSACREAVDHFSRALELLTGAVQMPERPRLELQLQAALGASLAMLKGYSNPDVERVYARALALCSNVADPAELLPIRAAIRNFHFVRGEYAKTRELGEQFKAAGRTKDDTANIEGSVTLGLCTLFTGQLDEAQRHFDDTIALCPRRYAVPPGLFVVEPGLIARRFEVLLSWMRGYPDRALRNARHAVDIAREMNDHFALAGVWSALNRIYYLRGELDLARAESEALVAFCSEQGFAFWRGTTTIELGMLVAKAGEAARGLELAEQGWAIFRSIGANVGITFVTMLVAEAYASAGRAAAALEMMREAFVALRDNQERYWEPELYRFTGILLSSEQTLGTNFFEPALGVPDSTEACLLKALATARRMGAKSFELRAALSLACFWQHSERRDEGRRILRATYASFGEGLDTPALQQARSFIEADCPGDSSTVSDAALCVDGGVWRSILGPHLDAAPGALPDSIAH